MDSNWLVLLLCSVFALLVGLFLLLTTLRDKKKQDESIYYKPRISEYWYRRHISFGAVFVVLGAMGVALSLLGYFK